MNTIGNGNNVVFITEHNRYPDFTSTLSHMRGHHPRGRELYDLSLKNRMTQLYYRGFADQRKNPIEDEAMKVVAELKVGKEVYLDGNNLKELVEYLEANRNNIEAREGNPNIFDKLNVIVEPAAPVPMLTKDLYYAKTIAGMWQANKELEQRRVA